MYKSKLCTLHAAVAGVRYWHDIRLLLSPCCNASWPPCSRCCTVNLPLASTRIYCLFISEEDHAVGGRPSAPEEAGRGPSDIPYMHSDIQDTLGSFLTHTAMHQANAYPWMCDQMTYCASLSRPSVSRTERSVASCGKRQWRSGLSCQRREHGRYLNIL